MFSHKKTREFNNHSKSLAPRLVDSRAFCVEHLESRFVPTISAGFSAGLLSVSGDSSANSIAISYAIVSGQNYVMVNTSGGTVFDGRPTASNVLTSSVSAISVNSGDGGDYIDLQDVQSANGFAGLNGNITLQGGAGVDAFAGSGFADQISGLDGNDIIEGKGGDDSLNGGNGDDTYIYYGTSLGSDLITEAASTGLDVVTFALYGSGVAVDLSSTSTQSVGGTTSLTFSSATGIEGFIGSVFADTVTGNSRDNIINGAGGNDTLSGGSGNDTYLFNSDPNGSDSITESSDADNDTLDFSGCDVGVTIDLSSTSSQSWGDGSITLSSTSGIESLVGSGFADSLTGNARSGWITGGAGNDTMVGAGGDDYYVFGPDAAGTDIITESAGQDNDFLYFTGVDVGVTIDLSSTSSQAWGDGTLTFSTSTSIEGVYGGAYNDSLTGNSENNILDGGAGSNTLIGGDGSDYLVSSGSSGQSSLLQGQDGDDYLAGGAGADTLEGGNGGDQLIGGAGNDSLVGGAGDDWYSFEDSAGTDTITEAATSDQDILFFDTSSGISIDLGSTSAQSWGSGILTLSSSTGIEGVVGSDYADTITGNSRANVLFGLGGNDTISGLDGNDTIAGFDGNDNLSGGNDNDDIIGDDGNDSISGGDGRDAIAGGTGGDTLDGGNGDDILIAGNAIFGTTLDQIQSNVDAVMSSWSSGSSYSDRVKNVTADTGAAAPLPNGQRLRVFETVFDDNDADSLTGGSDSDLFFYDIGEDTVTDNVMGETLIDIG